MKIPEGTIRILPNGRMEKFSGGVWVDTTDLLVCPFCKEIDFDLPGLKYHIKYHCEQFRETENI